jgi:hypothetical protein
VGGNYTLWRPGDSEVLISTFSASARSKPRIVRGIFIVQARKALRQAAIRLRWRCSYLAETGLRWAGNHCNMAPL